jgi:hypothetical protein
MSTVDGNMISRIARVLGGGIISHVSLIRADSAAELKSYDFKRLAGALILS